MAKELVRRVRLAWLRSSRKAQRCDRMLRSASFCASHPSLEKSEGWGTQICGAIKGGPPAASATAPLLKGMVPLPGGGTAVYNASGANNTPALNYIRHKDWLGSSVLATTWAHTIYSKESYAPFGEVYGESGTPDRSFTGQDQNVVTGGLGTGVYDFLFRKFDPSAGRWLSPDPYGWNAVDLTDPQLLNRYAYAMNRPAVLTDPLGLSTCVTWLISYSYDIYPFTAWPVNFHFEMQCIAQSQDPGGTTGGTGGSGGGAPNNGRQPNKITCGTVLPNGRTVGSYVNQLSNTINNAPQSISTPYGPSASYASGYSPLSVPGQVYKQTNFKIMFRGQGNAAFLGDAGNFAYAAVSANIGVPLWTTEAVAGGYALWAGHKDANGPWFMDASATAQVPAGYGAGCKE